MEVKITNEEINDICQLLEKVSEFCREGPTKSIWLRGHKDYDYELKPSIGRKHYYIGKSDIFDRYKEKNLLHRFRRYAYSHINRNIEEWEALLLARHYGLPVRLLDWTSNPLAALYFASCYYKELNTDGAIWGFLRKPNDWSDIDIFTEKSSPFDIEGVRIIYLFVNSSRMSAQSSAFTIQDDPWQCLEKYENKNCPNDIDKLIKWKIPKEKRANIIVELERSINYRILYPDLEGLAKGLWHSELIRKK